MSKVVKYLRVGGDPNIVKDWETCNVTEHICPRHVHIERLAGNKVDFVSPDDGDLNDNPMDAFDEAPVEEFKIHMSSWRECQDIEGAKELLSRSSNAYTLEVRKIGKGVKAIHQYKVDFKVPLAEVTGDGMEALAHISSYFEGLSDPEIKIGTEGVGGGQGHTDYATVARVIGWVTMTADNIKTMKTMQEKSKEHATKERKIAQLQKEIKKLRGF